MTNIYSLNSLSLCKSTIKCVPCEWLSAYCNGVAPWHSIPYHMLTSVVEHLLHTLNTILICVYQFYVKDRPSQSPSPYRSTSTVHTLHKCALRTCFASRLHMSHCFGWFCVGMRRIQSAVDLGRGHCYKCIQCTMQLNSDSFLCSRAQQSIL